MMKEFQGYKKQRMQRKPELWAGYQEKFETFKLGVLLKQAREEAGLTQEEVAQKLHTSKAVISRVENHAPNVRLSTLEKFAFVVGKKLHIALN